jgi:hypothetical protein
LCFFGIFVDSFFVLRGKERERRGKGEGRRGKRRREEEG